MATLSLTRLAVGVCGLALSLTAGAGIASADPNLDPIVNTTCNFPQVMSALNALDPQAAAAFNSSPANTGFLNQFLASPPPQRLRMAQMMQRSPGAQQYFGLIEQIAQTCNNYPS